MSWSIALEQFESGFGDLCPDHAAVVAVAMLANQFQRLEPASNRVMSGSAVIIRLPMAAQVSPRG